MNFVLGIDFGGTKVALATATPAGEQLRQVRLETLGTAGAQDVLRRTLFAAHRLVSDTKGDAGGRLVAAGVSTFGVVRGDRVLLAPNVPGWEELPLPELLTEALDAPTLRLDNDVNAAAAAEARWGRLNGVGVGLYVNLGTGLGAGIVVDGRVLRGANGAAGEIGYALHRPTQPGYGEGHAPLEEHVSGSGLARRGSLLLGRKVGAAELFKLRDDPPVTTLLDDALDVLGMAVANLVVALDPECVVVGGGMAAEPSVLPCLKERIASAAPFPPRIELARFAADAALMGALALAVDAAGENAQD